ncbi:MAG: SH3 domain-containing protein [Chloroflexi bacterium]|nr:SH3 domain-containing protein [Chloroflexota bacterium]
MKITNESAVTTTPDFVTSTLPSTKIPPPSHTPIPTAPAVVAITGTEEPILSSVEGITTTQLNVRAEPSTASETLGMVNQFATVQVIGKDASGSWYQIVYPNTGKGWVRAEYVQVNATAEIPVIGSVTGSGSGVSGLVIQKVNVRNGPGLKYESLGVLNPKDVVFITGKDSSGEWMQIEFASAAGGMGWAAVKYLQVENTDSIPVIGSAETTDTTPTASTVIFPAAQDGDSLQAPAAVGDFSAAGTHTLQVNGDVSAPDGDTEDWIQVTSFSKNILVEAKCSSSSLRVELWSGGQNVSDVALDCDGKLKLEIVPGRTYYFRIQVNGDNGPQYVQYVFKVSRVE